MAAVNGCPILVPSAAVAGLDGVKGARIGDVTARTREENTP